MKNKMFRREISGFNREDVSTYIAKLAEENRRDAANLKKSIDALTQKNKTLEEMIDKNLIEGLQNENSAQSAEITRLNQEILRLETETASRADENTHLHGEISLCKEQNALLLSRIDKLAEVMNGAKNTAEALAAAFGRAGMILSGQEPEEPEPSAAAEPERE